MRDFSVSVFKKHSKIIAKLGLRTGMIPMHLFNGLYWNNFRMRRSGRRRKKKGHQYKFPRYYTELYYADCDYWGEWDEHSIIDYVRDGFVWAEKNLTEKEWEGVTLPTPIKFYRSTLKIIKELRHGIQHGGLQRTKTKHIRINKSKLHRKQTKKNKVLRQRQFRY